MLFLTGWGCILLYQTLFGKTGDCCILLFKLLALFTGERGHYYSKISATNIFLLNSKSWTLHNKSSEMLEVIISYVCYFILLISCMYFQHGQRTLLRCKPWLCKGARRCTYWVDYLRVYLFISELNLWIR